MRKFKDRENNTFAIDLNMGTLVRIKTASDGRFNLFDPESRPGGDCGDRTIFQVLTLQQMGDLPAVWEVVYLAVEPQLGEVHPTAEAFGVAMAGDCLIAAQKALLEEWADFFRQLQRPDLAAALEKTQAYQETAAAMVRQTLADNQTLKELDGKVEARIQSALRKSVGDMEASLASILEGSLGDS